MSKFEDAINVILVHEGGWVDNPADPGGETQMGWSTSTIRKLGLTPRDLGLDQDEFTPGCLKAVTQATCIRLYRQYFWDKYHYQLLADQVVATKIFDCSVNCGPGRAATMAQKAAAACGQQIAVDGSLGPKSCAAVNAVPAQTFVHAMADQMRSYYNGLVAARPSLAVFKSNWLKRAAWGE